jgi:hypothetical protein
VLRRFIDRLDGQREQRKAGGRSGIRGGAAVQRKERGRGKEGEALTGGPRLSAAQRKKKRGGGRWADAGGRLGRLGRKGAGLILFFFLFFFQTSFSNHFSSLIQFKLFQTFLKNFIDFLETTQATKNHASQKMMHIHLLSLSLLIYL